MKPKVTGLTRIVHATKYSYSGIRAAWKSEAAFRQEVIVFCILSPIALLIPVSAVETLLLIGSVVSVIIIELINSAIEAVVDRIGPEKHTLSGQAKDMGSAAVLFATLLSTATWLTILGSNFVF